MCQEGVAPGGVEFAENVVEQKERCRFVALGENPRLSELEGEDRGALLAFAREVRGRPSIYEKAKIIPMRTNDGEAKTLLFRPGARELSGEIFLAPGSVFEPEHLAFAADFDLALRGHGGQLPDNLPPHGPEENSRANQRFAIGGKFPRPRMARFEQRVARSQRAFVGAESRAVTTVDLRADKIQKPPPHLGRTAHQIEIVVGERNDPRETEILSLVARFDPIESDLAPERAVIELEPMPRRVSGKNERAASDPQRRGEAGGSLRLQSQKHAGRLEQRGFSAAIQADNKVEPGTELDAEGVEAAKMAQLQIAKAHKCGVIGTRSIGTRRVSSTGLASPKIIFS